MLNRFALTIALGALACGGGPGLEAKEVTHRSYMATARCGQGPIVARFRGEGAKWGEGIRVKVCSPRGASGNIEVKVDGRVVNSGPLLGGRVDNSRCVLGDEVVAGGGAGPAEKAPAAHRGTGKAAGSRAELPPSRTRSIVREGEVGLDSCPYDSTDTELSFGNVSPGAEIVVSIWSERPLDLEGMFLKITHSIYEPNVSEEEYEKFLAKESERDREENERLAADFDLREAELAEEALVDRPRAAPPPARVEKKPPRLSVHAEWVPGYWHWHTGEWRWIGGRWRVPADDVSRGLTVRAPMPPPARRAEAPGLVLTGLVWIPGYWSFDGASYVWVGGDWRRPPRRDVTWRPPVWRARGRGVIFVPGGWISPN